MSGYSYEPAQAHEWLAVATAGRLLVAKTADGDEQVGAFAATSAADMSVQQVLEVLTAKGLGATGPFALLFWVDGDLTGQGLGVIVRGDARVTVTTTSETVSVSSRGVTTWTEQVIEGATGFMVDVDVDTPQAPALPLGAGAVWMSRISLSGDKMSAHEEHAHGARTNASRAAAPGIAPEAVPVVSQQSAAAPVDEETRVFHTSTRASEGRHDSTAADTTNAAEPEGYDYLFGATVFRPVDGGDASAGELSGDQDLPATAFLEPGTNTGGPFTDTKGDHDGRTVLASEISAARQQARASQQHGTAPVQAPAQAHTYILRLPDGSSQPLTAPVILGRAPSVSNVPASVLPHLVTLVGDDISRSHLRVAVEGGTVVVTDLHSSNGTHVIAPGKPPQLLRGGEPTPVIVGTAIDLGSDILLRITEA